MDLKDQILSFFEPSEKLKFDDENDIVMYGFLEIESTYLKWWEKRFIIMIETHLLVYKENDGNWKIPIEKI